MSNPAFRYTDVSVYPEAVSRTSEYFDPFVPTDLIAVNGRVVVLNGLQENTRLDVDGVAPLVMRAPRLEVLGMASGMGNGQLLGNGYKWRIRYKNSITGEVSGMSPNPTIGLNLGNIINDEGDWIGQKMIFSFEGTAYPGVDIIQLLRNTTEQESIYLVLTELANPGAGSYVDYTDDETDNLIVGNEQAALNPNPMYAEGHPPPCSRGHIHSTRRLFIYGMRERAISEGGQVSITKETDLVTVKNLTRARFETGMEGCRFKPVGNSSGSTISNDDTVYRILEVVDNDNLRVTPEFKENDLMTAGVLADCTYQIIDDRNDRTFWMSEPNKPTSYDVLKALSVVSDSSDKLLYIGAFGGVTYLVTQSRIFAALDDFTEAPWLTMRFVPVANEGTVGFNSCIATPFGLIFINEEGVRIFDGSGAPRPLGTSGSVFQGFPAKTTFESIEPAMLSSSVVLYDTSTRKIHVLYAPSESQVLEASLTFDPVTGAWRGPWRRNIVTGGVMRNDDGSESYVLGGLWGGIGSDEAQSLDGVNSDGHTLTGAPTLVYNTPNRMFQISGATFDAQSDKRLVGCPITLETAAGVRTRTYIVDVPSATDLVVAPYPFSANTDWNNITAVEIGSIDWDLLSAYFDTGEAIQPKTLEQVRLRFERGSASEPFSVISIAEEDGTEVADEGGTVDPQNSVHRLARPTVGGRSFQLRLRGGARSGLPKIAQVIADVHVHEGV